MGGELQEFCSLIVDCPHSTAPVSAEAYAYAVGTTAISSDGAISFDKARPVDADTYAKWTARAVPMSGDLVFCREAPVGPVVVAPEAPRVCLGQRTMLLRVDPNQLDPHWLAYFLRAPATLAQLLARSEGSTVAHLDVSDVRSFPLEPPPLSDQRAIASILRALDHKLESNRRLVQPSVTPDELFEQFSIPAFDAGEQPEVSLGSSMASGKTLLPPERVILISKLNPRTPRVWDPVVSGRGTAVCSPEFVALRPNRPSDHAWLDGVIRSDPRFYMDVLATVGGTTGSRQRVRPADVLFASMPQVSPEARSEWAAFAGPMIEREAALLREIRSLSELRDASLPRLVSGRLRVSGETV